MVDEYILQELLKEVDGKTKDEEEEESNAMEPNPGAAYEGSFEALEVAFKWFEKQKESNCYSRSEFTIYLQKNAKVVCSK